jgi:hypothetical protein
MTRCLTRLALASAAVVGLAGCKSDNLVIPQYNAPTVDGVNKDPNGVQLYVTGILYQLRAAFYQHTFGTGILGRESYYYFPTDPRFVSHYLIGQTVGGVRQLDPAGFASGDWFIHFTNIRNTVNLSNLSNGSNLSAPQKAGVLGFAQTIHALHAWYAIVSRDTLGTPVDIPANPATPAAFQTRTAVFKFIQAELDSGAAALQSAGGTAFPFTMTGGFGGFDSPATFLRVNRAIAARVANDFATKGCGNACYTQALAMLQASFIAPAASQADLNIGVWNVYSATSGDLLNAENISTDPNYLAHASGAADAQLKPDGTPDNRSLRKIASLATPRPSPGSGIGIPATKFFAMYPSTTTPSRIFGNEELLLIRAEANMGLGNQAAALADINMVRTVSGGLAPLASLGSDPVGTLLYERHFSLLNEGHRWNDARRFGRLNSLPLDLPSHFVARVYPIPTQECNARAGTPVAPPTGC